MTTSPFIRRMIAFETAVRAHFMRRPQPNAPGYAYLPPARARLRVLPVLVYGLVGWAAFTVLALGIIFGLVACGTH